MHALPITLIPAPDESATETPGYLVTAAGGEVFLHLKIMKNGSKEDKEARQVREAVEKELLQNAKERLFAEAENKEVLQKLREAIEAYPEEAQFSVSPGGTLTELQTLAIAVGPALCTALGVWLGSRNGRKVRIKIGDIEAEAQTQEQVEKLLARAQEIQQEIQQRNQPPKVIP